MLMNKNVNNDVSKDSPILQLICGGRMHLELIKYLKGALFETSVGFSSSVEDLVPSLALERIDVEI